LVCSDCERDHDDNESIPPCVKGEWDNLEKEPGNPAWVCMWKCPLRRIVLLPENAIAWDLYWMAKSDISDLLFMLSDYTITKVEAMYLIRKLKVIDNELMRLRYESIKEMDDKT